MEYSFVESLTEYAKTLKDPEHLEQYKELDECRKFFKVEFTVIALCTLLQLGVKSAKPKIVNRGNTRGNRSNTRLNMANTMGD